MTPSEADLLAPERLLVALSGECFATIRLDTALRQRLLALVSWLAGRGALDIRLVARMFMPLLAGLAARPAEFAGVLEAELRLLARAPLLKTGPLRNRLREPVLQAPGRSIRAFVTFLMLAMLLMLALGSDQPPPSKAPESGTAMAATRSGGTGTVPIRVEADPGTRLDTAAILAILIARTPSWAFGSVLIGFALLLFLGRFYWPPLRLERSMARLAGPAAAELAIPGRRRPAIDPRHLAVWRRIATEPIPGRTTFNLERTAFATARAGGLIMPVFSLRRIVPETIVLLEQTGPRDALASWWRHVFQRLQAEGTHLRIAAYQTLLGASRQLADRYGRTRPVDPPSVRSRLVIVAAGVPRDFESERRRWREAGATSLLASALSLSPLTVRGDPADKSDASAAAEHRRAFRFPGRNLMDEAPIDDLSWERLRAVLRFELEPDGLRWLAGCAQFSSLSEQLFWAVGQALGITDAQEYENMGQLLLATPWLRAGWFPQPVRKRLEHELRPDDRAALRSLVAARLRVRGEQGKPEGADPLSGRGATEVSGDSAEQTRFAMAGMSSWLVRSREVQHWLGRGLLPGYADRLAVLLLGSRFLPLLVLGLGVALIVPGSAPLWLAGQITDLPVLLLGLVVACLFGGAMLLLFWWRATLSEFSGSVWQQLRARPWAIVVALAATLATGALAYPVLNSIREVIVKLPAEMVPRPVVPKTELPAVEPVTLEEFMPDEAKALNASIPFSALPNPAARPFSISGSAASQARALDCLAVATFYAAGDDANLQRAMAQLVINRTRHPAFPKSICGVVFQGRERSSGCQFSFACDGALTRYRPSVAQWERARGIASAALSGSVYAPVGHATHYHTDWVVPYWSASLEKVVQINSFLFFRWSGWWGTAAAFRSGYAGAEPAIPAMANFTEGELPAALPTPAPDAQPASSSVDGNSFLVTLPAGIDADAIAALAIRTCGTRSYCKFMAWADPGERPAKLPMTARQVSTMSFSYLRDTQQGFAKGLWNCQQYRRPSPAQCMRAQPPAQFNLATGGTGGR